MEEHDKKKIPEVFGASIETVKSQLQVIEYALCLGEDPFAKANGQWFSRKRRSGRARGLQIPHFPDKNFHRAA